MTDESQLHAAVVDAIAPGAHLEDVIPYRRTPRPFPAKLIIATDDGSISCVVKVFTDPDGSRREAAALNALADLGDLGFATPRVLAGPIVVTTSTGPVEALAISVAPGRALPWINVTEVEPADRACRILFEAIDRLHALTPRLADHPIAAALPTRTLDDELAAARRESPWSGARLVREALEVLPDAVRRHRRPLVFSNGDYNPLNVLSDEAGLSAWIDFELAGFEDPLVGLPKFQFWADDSGWSLGAQVGLVERFLYRHQVTPAAYQVRVALRGLTHLHQSSPDHPPTTMVRQIEQAIEVLRRDDAGS